MGVFNPPLTALEAILHSTPRYPLNLHLTPPLSNKKASNKKLDSQISYFNRISKDLITKSNKNSLLEDKKSRLSLEKSSFLLDLGGCNRDIEKLGAPGPNSGCFSV